MPKGLCSTGLNYLCSFLTVPLETNYLRLYQTNLRQIFRICACMGGHDKSDLLSRSLSRICYGKQPIFGANHTIPSQSLGDLRAGDGGKASKILPRPRPQLRHIHRRFGAYATRHDDQGGLVGCRDNGTDAAVTSGSLYILTPPHSVSCVCVCIQYDMLIILWSLLPKNHFCHKMSFLLFKTARLNRAFVWTKYSSKQWRHYRVARGPVPPQMKLWPPAAPHSDSPQNMHYYGPYL